MFIPEEISWEQCFLNAKPWFLSVILGTEEPPFELAEEAGLCPESHGSGAVDAELDRRPAPTGGYMLRTG